MAITRRALLKGAAATAAAAVPLAPGLALAHGDEDEETDGHDEETDGHDEAEASARIRRWAMVIDLRAATDVKGSGSHRSAPRRATGRGSSPRGSSGSRSTSPPSVTSRQAAVISCPRRACSARTRHA